MGLSNGGMMAQSAGCEFPEIFDGVINIVGMQPYELSCIPDKPTSLIIYGGILDKTTPPVSIQSSGGYLYEPILKTASDWAKKFKCIKSLEVIANAGHCPHDEKPEEVNKILLKIKAT